MAINNQALEQLIKLGNQKLAYQAKINAINILKTNYFDNFDTEIEKQSTYYFSLERVTRAEREMKPFQALDPSENTMVIIHPVFPGNPSAIMGDSNNPFNPHAMMMQEYIKKDYHELYIHKFPKNIEERVMYKIIDVIIGEYTEMIQEVDTKILHIKEDLEIL
jgi:hypothetical protein